ncbi:MAG TPA: hypothetical protein VM925_07095 [Labilithrix sp.]|nr:hypothetical protein [Labilithrix sp.]
MRKTPHKKRVMRSLRPRSNVDPTRMALAALERIKTVLVRSGHEERFGAPVSMQELAAQAQLIGAELPASYIAAMRVASKIGDPERLLLAREMKAEAERITAFGGEEAKRYAPFCKGVEHVVCFDIGGPTGQHEGELPIVEWRDGSASPAAAHFGEWLDSIADAREESVETAAKMPARLKRLLYELGFRFEYPVVGRLETGDTAAVASLIGDDLARSVRGDVDRLFDSSGKASLTLDVDEFTLAVSLRTGIYVFEAEDVFRWLRTFRDENFFSDVVTVPSHPDVVRDLRRPPREAPLIQRGVVHLPVAPAKNVAFRAASGREADDFYLLARTASTSERAPSIILHIVDGEVATSHKVEEPLNDLHVARDGTMWGLTTTHAVRIAGGRAQSFPLGRPTRGRPWWYGIGGAGDRVLVWGAGALLEFDGRGFVPFEPDAMLDETESVVALHASGLQMWMLVCGDHVGAVGRFDSVSWLPITEHQVIDATLSDLDVWHGVAYVLDRDGGVWKIDGGPPHPVALLTYHQAYLTETGAPRALQGVRAFDGGLLLASRGGVIAVGGTEPLFHAIPNGRDPVRLVRVGGRPAAEGHSAETTVVALSGPNAWIWQQDAFSVIDLSDW